MAYIDPSDFIDADSQWIDETDIWLHLGTGAHCVYCNFWLELLLDETSACDKIKIIADASYNGEVYKQYWKVDVWDTDLLDWVHVTEGILEPFAAYDGIDVELEIPDYPRNVSKARIELYCYNFYSQHPPTIINLTKFMFNTYEAPSFVPKVIMI